MQRMSDRVTEAKDMYHDGTSYTEMCNRLGVGVRQLRRLLSAANIRRRVGRPTTQPSGQRISYAQTGMF